MRGVLVDTGPLVAIMDADDGYHARCVEALERIREPLFTVWPVITEAMYLLGALAGQQRLLEILENGALELLPLSKADVPRVSALMKKYADLPMDFADAALVRVAERDRIHTVFTTDSTDFGVYRLEGRRRFRLSL